MMTQDDQTSGNKVLMPDPPYRPLHIVTLSREGNIYEDGVHMKIAMSRRRLRLGCTEVDVEAAKKILEIHAQRFGSGPEPEFVPIQ
ncbi:MAG TPA: hypothetical protein VH280_14825 [Verrucomicrobiae bacterium]|jgi:hypothetical protein|nr:hypothetical protein [Verrucomicrobiae bacterium]